MSPRITPKQAPIATVAPQAGDGRTPPDVRLSEQQREADYLDSLAEAREDVYAPEGPFSYYRDLLTLERAHARTHGTLEAPRYQIGDPGPEPGSEAFGAPTVLEAQRRLSRVAVQQRDGSAPDAMRPSLPGALSAIWGKAARRGIRRSGRTRNFRLTASTASSTATSRWASTACTSGGMPASRERA